eukprot:5315899-Prorocentrum_lima.AAC.1
MSMLVLSGAVGRVIHEDPSLKRVLYDKLIQPPWRNTSSVWDVLPLVRAMIGEVRVRAQEEEE